ncbi:sulfatase-like hydrolase/transferase, partial [Candidatus Poribacteria bacterium]|nr:sulfatase-like hydrolase/transferase [Candidatus Poribacteria bacterium]
DQFAEESVVFKNAVSNYPASNPYMAMLFTGMYPHSNGVIAQDDSDTAEYNICLRENNNCFPDILNNAGYNQKYIGKYQPDIKPEEQESISVDEWPVTRDANLAVNYIRNEKGKYRDENKPFSLFVNFNPFQKSPKQIPSKYLDAYKDKSIEDLLDRPNVKLKDAESKAEKYVRNYFASVTGMDENFGRILKAVEEEKLQYNTIVVFTSDHGEMMGSHGLMQSGVWYEESILIPFIISWPEVIDPGEENALLSIPDIMPTLLNLMELGDFIPEETEGIDYSEIFFGDTVKKPGSVLYFTIPSDWPEGGRRGVRAVRYTFVIERHKGEKEKYILHDNERDPYQNHNIAKKNPEIMRELNEDLNEWLEKTKDPWLKIDDNLIINT